VIWGCGTAYNNEIVPGKFGGPQDFKIIATRGPLTMKMVQDCGHQPLYYGDPGLLLPRWFKPTVEKRYELGIVQSWVDKDQIMAQYGQAAHIIDIMQPVEEVITQICACERVVAGCLHGLIAAVAYGVPTVGARISNRLLGDGTKFKDFLQSIGHDYQPLDLTKQWNISDLKAATFRHTVGLDLDKLYAICPFRPALGNANCPV
jgi:pyruvyltransferase